MSLTEIFSNARIASRTLPTADSTSVDSMLIDMASAIESNAEEILAANAKDLSRMDPEDPKYDRLKLTYDRISAIAADMRHVAALPSPLDRVLDHRVLPNGLDISRVSVPFGVIGVIYEARPNVSFDVFSLCVKAGSACVLKGGHDADDTNRTVVALLRSELERAGFCPDVVQLLPATHEATAEMLAARGFIDVIIPRGSASLIRFVRDNARVPVIETGAGVCHAYFDAAGDLDKGRAIVNNAKTRRVSVCNALDCLLVDRSRLQDLPLLCAPLSDSRVVIKADDDSYTALAGVYSDELLMHAVPDDFGTEFLGYTMAVRTVDGIDGALDHIARYGSGHSESVITENRDVADVFTRMVDAACVYTNAPTSFTDGAQFGLGAEIGISTQKLHARGPMALDEMTTYKWIIRGNGQTRPR